MPWRRQTNTSLTDNPQWASSVYTVVDTMRDFIINEFKVTPTIDAFATKHNRRFKRYWDKSIDAFTRDWSSEPLLWINGPFEHYNRVVDKLISDKANAIIVCPMWERMKWWKRLQSIATASYVLPLGVKIFQNKEGKALRPRPWRTVALLVDGSRTSLSDDMRRQTKNVDNNSTQLVMSDADTIMNTSAPKENAVDNSTQTDALQNDSEKPSSAAAAIRTDGEMHVHYHIYYHGTC